MSGPVRFSDLAPGGRAFFDVPRAMPDLDPADAVHIPRWLDELREAQGRGEYAQRHHVGVEQRDLAPVGAFWLADVAMWRIKRGGQ